MEDERRKYSYICCLSYRTDLDMYNYLVAHYGKLQEYDEDVKRLLEVYVPDHD